MRRSRISSTPRRQFVVDAVVVAAVVALAEVAEEPSHPQQVPLQPALPQPRQPPQGAVDAPVVVRLVPPHRPQPGNNRLLYFKAHR